eukprot:CAMPEP_0170073462 /NCGR_PEP_ID=MMETSP0019_2-20121128/10877_1 /TAXON_ID=98059 /ORGANISM="Dinobryon sp., Strain UTEXLB2267" /LENGTH=198 /DNA_ID=CAMNT_0010283011 /DNA_START=378 /DNA_END=974 /DNA_ORIENTATION=+
MKEELLDICDLTLDQFDIVVRSLQPDLLEKDTMIKELRTPDPIEPTKQFKKPAVLKSYFGNSILSASTVNKSTSVLSPQPIGLSMNKNSTIQPCIVKPPMKRRHANLTIKEANTTSNDHSSSLTNQSSSPSELNTSNETQHSLEREKQEKLLEAKRHEELKDAAYMIWRDEVVARKRRAAEGNGNLISIRLCYNLLEG